MMAIINIFKSEKKEEALEDEFLGEVAFAEEETIQGKTKGLFSKDAFLSTLCVRLFFLILLAFTFVWIAYALCKVAVFSSLQLIFWKKWSSLNFKLSKSWLSLKRAFISSVSLMLAMLSPALGIMVACTYFLMYDKAGIEEVVPSSLRDQFKDLFAQTDLN